MSRRRAPAAAAFPAFGLLPGAAFAHSPVPGIEGFYWGLLHPATVPSQLLVLAALGILLGQGLVRQTAVAWATFAGAMLAGIAAGQTGAEVEWAELPLILVAMGAAALGALRPGTGPAAVALSACGGFLVGLGSTPEPGPVRPTAITLAGSVAGANLGLLYVSGIAGWLRERVSRPWMHVGLRILAAWIAAIAALLAALVVATPDRAIEAAQLSQVHLNSDGNGIGTGHAKRLFMGRGGFGDESVIPGEAFPNLALLEI